MRKEKKQRIGLKQTSGYSKTKKIKTKRQNTKAKQDKMYREYLLKAHNIGVKNVMNKSDFMTAFKGETTKHRYMTPGFLARTQLREQISGKFYTDKSFKAEWHAYNLLNDSNISIEEFESRQLYKDVNSMVRKQYTTMIEDLKNDYISSHPDWTLDELEEYMKKTKAKIVISKYISKTIYGSD